MKSRIDSHTLKVLDFDKILTLLTKFTTSEVGTLFCQSITPEIDPSSIKKGLRQVTEMKCLIGTHGLLPLHDVKLITPFIKKAEPEGAFLIPRELLAILLLLRSSRTIKTILTKNKEVHSSLWEVANHLKILTDMENALSVAIDPEGELLDTASRELESIRVKIKKIRGHIKSVLETIINHPDNAFCIQEKIITIRNERYVIPIKSDFKTRIPGVVHDQSNNQATYFIEPFKIVDLNNELILLMKEEEEEEIRILQQLTTVVRENKEFLLSNQTYLGKLDVIQAKAQLSEKMGAREPELVDRREIKLLQARHPLLLLPAPSPERDEPLPIFDDSKVVPIDLLFPPGFSILVITGSNMGGKTATLKTIGLLTLMVQTGIHIPVAEGSQLALWEKVFADIGDEQNLEENVSTFSSHINQVNNILNQANEKSLVLLDELGAGTDPQEGAALGLAIIETLRKRQAKVAVTSHLNLLKAYAASLSDVMNVSVAFNEFTLQPTFTLLYGVPGNSNAFETAARLGVNPHVLELAKTYLKEHDRRILELIEELDRTIQRTVAMKGSYENLICSASRYEQVMVTVTREIAAQKEAILSQMEMKSRSLFQEAETEIKKLLKSKAFFEKKHLAEVQQKISSVKKTLKGHLITPKRPAKKIGGLKKGDRVILGKERKEGKVVAIDYASQKVEVQLDGIRLKTGIDDLSRIQNPNETPDQKRMAKNAGPTSMPYSDSGGVLAPLNLIGFTIDEALPSVDKAIDNALLYGIKEVRIIHGLGTGRLRQAIHDYLKQQPVIKNFYLGSPLEGGAGITIVELKA